jgi:hypothetical protein
VTLPCNEGRCDSSGTFHPGTGCGTDECCCNGVSCRGAEGCGRGGGSCE